MRHARVGAEEVDRESGLSYVSVHNQLELGKATWPLACRVHLSAQGAEWFIYNRTAAYDDIISQMQGGTLRRSSTAETQHSTVPPKGKQDKITRE